MSEKNDLPELKHYWGRLGNEPWINTGYRSRKVPEPTFWQTMKGLSRSLFGWPREKTPTIEQMLSPYDGKGFQCLADLLTDKGEGRP